MDISQGFTGNKSSLTKHRDTYPFIDPYRFKSALTGKVAVVTLAHRGLGRSTALAFAAAGASVVCISPKADSLQHVQREIKEKYNTPTLALTANLLEASAPARIVQLVEQNLGPIDILVNITPAQYLRAFTQEPDILTDWWPSLEATVRGPVALTHAVLPSMIARQTGTIISTVGVLAAMDMPFLSLQGVSKAALVKFHHQLNLETETKGIVCFAVNPGPIPSFLHDPDAGPVMDPAHVDNEPRFGREILQRLMTTSVEWCAVGLGSGTFVALASDPRARCLSGLYVNAERDLGELIAEVERDPERIARERLHVLKVDEI